MEKENIDQLVSTIRELTIALNGIKGKTYHFNEVSSEGVLNPEIEFKKYLLKNTYSDFISTEELQEGRELRIELDTEIKSTLGNEFINISFVDNSSHTRYSDGIEQFSLIFRKTYDKIPGSIRALRVDDRPGKVKLGDNISELNGKSEINIDFVRTSCLKYIGPYFKNKNVLLFGPNIEENPYIVELFNCFPPKKLTNIVPLGSMRSFFDNVD